MEQFVRDARIAQIYEGTNGVQAMDLIGRKLTLAGGAVVDGYFDLIAAELAGVETAEARAMASRVADALTELRAITASVRGASVDVAGAAAVDYLRLFALVSMGWMWVRMVDAARGDEPLHAAKRGVGAYYVRRVLPQALGLAAAIRAGADPIMDIPAEML
jgi:hypothetical protein